MSNEKNEYNEEYDKGYNEGKNDDFIQNISHSVSKGFKSPGSDDKVRQSYNAGYEDGSSDKYDDDNSSYSGGTSESSSSCFITTACITSKGLPDNCHELEILRIFRDTYVANLPDGKELLRQYYQNAPRIVDAINKSANAKEIYDALYVEISNAVQLIVDGDNDGAFENYSRVVKKISENIETILLN